MITKISLTIDFSSKDPEAECVQFLAKRIMDAVPQAKVTVLEPTAQTAAATQPAAEAKPAKKRGRPVGYRKPKAPTVAEVAAEKAVTQLVEEAAEQAVVQVLAEMETKLADAVPTMEDAQAALRDVFTKGGMEGARGLLQQFGALRVSDLKEADRAEFVKAAKALVA